MNNNNFILPTYQFSIQYNNYDINHFVNKIAWK